MVAEGTKKRADIRTIAFQVNFDTGKWRPIPVGHLPRDVNASRLSLLGANSRKHGKQRTRHNGAEKDPMHENGKAFSKNV